MVSPRAPRFDSPTSYETYKPNPRQAMFHGVRRWEGFNKLIKGAIGGIGGGKSAAVFQEMAWIAMHTPGGASVMGRGSMPKADLTLISEFGEFIGPFAEWKHDCFWYANGHRTEVIPFDKPDRLGSTKFVAAGAQETQELDYRVWSTLSERLRDPHGIVDGIPYYRLLFDARPIESRHWLKEKFIDLAWDIETGPDNRQKARKPFYVYVRFESFDNQANLRPGYIEELLEEHRDEPGWIKMMIEGEVGYSLEGAPVYGEVYRPEVHDATIEEDPRLPILRGWDFGFRSPAVLWCQWTRSGQLLVLREYCPKKVQRDQFVDEMLAQQALYFPHRHPSQYRDFGDIAGQQADFASGEITTMHYIEERLNTSFEGLQKNNIEDGIEVVRTLMRRPAKYRGAHLTCFLVDTRCETLREALRGMYAYPEKGGEHRPPKKGTGYDDVCDCLRYVAQSVASESADVATVWRDSEWEGETFARY